MNLNDKIFVILRSALNKKKLDKEFKDDFSYQDFTRVCKILQAHDLAHLFYDVVDKNGISFTDEGFSKSLKRLMDIKNIWLYRYVSIEAEYESICSLFDREKIEYLPLKGAVLRDYYPEGWMRTSCDIDILIHETDLKKAKSLLETELLYTTEATDGFHDWSFFSQNKVHLELHYNLGEDVPFLDKHLDKVWDNVVKNSESSRLKMTDEFFAFHIITHMTYHFLNGGCGIRPLMDLWVLKSNNLYDEEKVKTLCGECGILEFYNVVSAISYKWFSGREISDEYLSVEEYIVNGGVYGSNENMAAVKISRDKNAFTYYMKRTFLPYSSMTPRYPILKKLPFLLPVFWVVRGFKCLSSGKVKNNIDMMKTRNGDNTQKIEGVLKQVGLNEVCK